MPAVLIPPSVYLLVRTADQENLDVVLFEDQRNPGRTAIVIFTNKKFITSFKNGLFNNAEHTLREIPILEAEQLVIKAKEDGIETLLVVEDPENVERCRLGVLTEVGGRVTFARA